MDLAAGTRLGRYEIQSPLGRGGMGAVYLARDLNLRRPVALKLLPADIAGDAALLERFRREAQIVVALNHPHIVTVYDAGELDGVPYLATELIEGVTLRQRLEAGPLPIPELLRVGAQVAAALGAAHEAGIVHRDVKPENVMLRRDGYVKVLDFGVAKLLETAPAIAAGAQPTRDSAVVGTVRYMSPEQLRGEPVDGRSDLWSLGVVLQELATGEHPFPARTPSGVIAAILTAPVPRASAAAPARVPVALDAILARALERDPVRRYARGEDLAADLERLRAALETRAGSDHQHTQVIAGDRDSSARDSGGGWSDLAEALREPSATSAPRHNLPAATTSFHGRADTLAVVARELRRDHVRLLVVVGPGGAGKTRLAVEAARALVDDFPDGVWLVPLAAVVDAEALPGAIADVLAVKELGDRPSLDSLAAWLRPRHLLLVLDNLEQVADAAPALGRLLAASPGLHLLITSRRVLHLQGEHDLLLPPLALPDPAGRTPDEVVRSPAVELFLARARAVDPGFELDVANARAIAALCRHLDGLPLAIELAAARVRVLPPAAMLKRLDDRFRLLATGSGDLPDRHRTLRATLDWGYDLLAEPEQRLFRRLGVFRGGFTLSAAVAICGEAGDDDLVMLERLGALLDKSLLLRLEGPHEQEPRFALLESIREYARARQEPAEREELRRRHGAFFIDLAERGVPELAPATADVPLSVLAAAADDLREALAWALEEADVEPALRLTGSLWWFWYLHGHYREGRQWADRALARAPRQRTAARARTLLGAGMLAYLQCDYPAAEAFLAESRELARELDERRVLAASLQFAGSVARERGAYDAAAALHGESRALWRSLADARGEARSCNYLAFVAWLRGDLATAEVHAAEAHARFTALGDREGLAWALLNRAAIACYRRDLHAARRAGREALALASEADYKEGVAWSLNLLGVVALREGRSEQAGALLRRSLELHRDLGDRWRMASVAEALAAVARADGLLERGVRLDAAAAALRATLGTPQPPAEASDVEAERAAAVATLGEERTGALRREGEALRPEQLAAYALETG